FDPNADAHLTPYSQPNWAKKMPGVMIQAHMISQLLSAVRDRRPLLWWFPEWVEALWIGIWSVLGGIWVWGCKSPWMLGMAIALSLMVLYGLCLLILGAGGWVPFIPAALSLMLASMAGLIYTRQVNVYRH
ncbi:MAG TPA: CHASE2 domain-containing protein, partial [Allocoleopsis sp.]